MRDAVRSARYWGPLVLGLGCVVASTYTGNLVTWLLLLAGFALILDGATAMWARAGGSGGMHTYRQ